MDILDYHNIGELQYQIKNPRVRGMQPNWEAIWSCISIHIHSPLLPTGIPSIPNTGCTHYYYCLDCIPTSLRENIAPPRLRDLIEGRGKF